MTSGSFHRQRLLHAPRLVLLGVFVGTMQMNHVPIRSSTPHCVERNFQLSARILRSNNAMENIHQQNTSREFTDRALLTPFTAQRSLPIAPRYSQSKSEALQKIHGRAHVPCAAVAINATTEVRVSDCASYEVTVWLDRARTPERSSSESSLLSLISLTLSHDAHLFSRARLSSSLSSLLFFSTVLRLLRA